MVDRANVMPLCCHSAVMQRAEPALTIDGQVGRWQLRMPGNSHDALLKASKQLEVKSRTGVDVTLTPPMEG